MPAEQVARRIYAAMPLQLFGACLTALGQLRARIESQDAERGTIVAVVGAGPLAPTSELAMQIVPIDDRQAELVVTWRAQGRGGDRRIPATLLEAVGTLLGAGNA